MEKLFCVIGSNSFSGSDFIDLLLDDPTHRVFGISRSPEKSPVFLKYKSHPNVGNFHFHQYDLNRHTAEIVDLLDSLRPNYIVNFAALLEPGASWQAPEQWFETNCVALARLINQLKDRAYIEKYLHVSTPEVYGSCSGDVTEAHPLNPSTPYAASKAGADFLLHCMHWAYGFPVVTVRSTNVYGAHQQLFRIIPKTMIRLRSGNRIELHGGGKSVKSYIHIRDVSRGELKVLLLGQAGNTYHLSPGKGISIRELVMTVCREMGKPFEDSVVDIEERLGQDAVYEINSARARAEFGWSCEVSLEEGIREVIAWIDKVWEVVRNDPLEYIHKP